MRVVRVALIQGWILSSETKAQIDEYFGEELGIYNVYPELQEDYMVHLIVEEQHYLYPDEVDQIIKAIFEEEDHIGHPPNGDPPDAAFVGIYDVPPRVVVDDMIIMLLGGLIGDPDEEVGEGCLEAGKEKFSRLC